jgi:hypothetical protein
MSRNSCEKLVSQSNTPLLPLFLRLQEEVQQGMCVHIFSDVIFMQFQNFFTSGHQRSKAPS